MIDSRCGLLCSKCSYKTTHGCNGCIESNGVPFHGSCSLAKCCQEKNIIHCGQCLQFPCNKLRMYSCDPLHGDNPHGARIEQCKKWIQERG